jgi:hypothetical protein
LWIGISEILEKISTTELNTRKVHIFWETKFCEIFTLLSGSDYWESTPGDAGAKALLGSAIFSVDIQNVRFIWSTYTVGTGCTKKNIFSFFVRINKIEFLANAIFLFQCQCAEALLRRSKNPGVSLLFGGHNLPPSPPPPVAPSGWYRVIWSAKIWECHGTSVTPRNDRPGENYFHFLHQGIALNFLNNK